MCRARDRIVERIVFAPGGRGGDGHAVRYPGLDGSKHETGGGAVRRTHGVGVGTEIESIVLVQCELGGRQGTGLGGRGFDREFNGTGSRSRQGVGKELDAWVCIVCERGRGVRGDRGVGGVVEGGVSCGVREVSMIGKIAGALAHI